MIIIKSLSSYWKKEQFDIYREIILTIIISAVVSGCLNLYLDSKMDDRISYRQVMYDFEKRFFDNPKYRNISVYIEEDYLGEKITVPTPTDYELDDYLGLLNNIWLFYHDGFVSKELINRQYWYYFCITYNSPLVKKYTGTISNQDFEKESNYVLLLSSVIKDLDLDGKDCKNFNFPQKI